MEHRGNNSNPRSNLIMGHKETALGDVINYFTIHNGGSTVQ